MRDPDLQGARSAWAGNFICPLAFRLTIQVPPGSKDQSACLRAWLVHGGWHPFWSFWEIAVIHLRDIEGVPPAKKQYPEAEYEFQIISLESPPGCDVHPDPDDIDSLRHLMPPDVVYQFHGLTDEQAGQVADRAVSIILAGTSPDSDFRTYWVEMILPGIIKEVSGT